MKKILVLSLLFFGSLPFACVKKCDDPRPYRISNPTLSFFYYGTVVTDVPSRKDTFAYKMDTDFRFHAFLSGERDYTASLSRPFFDGGILHATEPCLEDYSTGFKIGIDSFVLRADRNIGLVPAGESLNALFHCDYSNTLRPNAQFITLQALNDSIQSGTINLNNLTNSETYRLIMKPNKVYFYGKHIFTLEVYRKDQTFITQSTDVLILE